MDEKRQPPEYIEAVYSRPRAVTALTLISRALVALTAAVFVFSAAVLLLDEWTVGCAYIFFTGVPFVAVSLVRAVINSARPYEVYLMPEGFIGTGRRSGRSYPSRHVFSSFVIGVMSFAVHPILGILLLLFGVCLGACRVLLGIHFIKDVLAGALVGVFSGTAGMLIVNYCL